MPLLQRGNKKLGDAIHSFSLPAGATCPGETAACARVCYAKRGHFLHANVQKSYVKNVSLARAHGFVRRMQEEIFRASPRVVRIHSSGDFYSGGYINKWRRVARSCPEVLFLAYTRSWRVPAIRRALLQFSRLPNVRLWLSSDRDTGRPPRWKHCRVAYMQSNPEDPVPAWADLVFRVQRDSVQKYAAGAIVCPAENGITQTTCSQCALCFRPPKTWPSKAR